jgi:predicted DNA-binding transcriptional regulator YafY
MPAASAPSTSRRLLELLTLLQVRQEWPARALAERLGVTERTVRRDIERLRELDYAIAATPGLGGGYRLSAGAQLPPLLFDDGQAVALALALRTAAATGARIADDAARALVTLERSLPSRLAHRVDGLAAVDAGTEAAASVDPAVLLRIGEAIRARRELRFGYGEVDDGPPRRTEPHHLMLHAGRWYVLGYTAERDDWRVYRVDRMALRAHDGAAFTPRAVPGGDAGRFLAARFKGSTTDADEWPCRGSAVLAARRSAVAPFVGDGTLEELAPERFRLTLGSWSWPALAAAFARFDADLSEVEPAELRDGFAKVADRLRAAAGE